MFSSAVPDVAVDDLAGVEGFEGVAHGYAHFGHLGVGFSAPTFLNDLRGPRMPYHLGEDKGRRRREPSRYVCVLRKACMITNPLEDSPDFLSDIRGSRLSADKTVPTVLKI